APVRMRADGLEVTNGDVIDGLVLRAIGYRARPVAGLPFEEATATVPNDGGRVEPGVYVTGWIKRGPTGFIGTNKTCSDETVARDLAVAAAEADRVAVVRALGRPVEDARREQLGVEALRRQPEARAVLTGQVDHRPGGADVHVAVGEVRHQSREQVRRDPLLR